MSNAANKAGTDAVQNVHLMLMEEGLKGNDWAEKGWEAVPAADNQLQIDYDSEVIPKARFDFALSILDQIYPGKWQLTQFRSRSNMNWHVLVTVPEPLSIFERLAWHGVFGSDYKRDALIIKGVHDGVKNPMLLIMNRNAKPEKSVCGRKIREE